MLTYKSLRGGWYRCNQTGELVKKPRRHRFANRRLSARLTAEKSWELADKKQAQRAQRQAQRKQREAEEQRRRTQTQTKRRRYNTSFY